jgi:DNA (cytosine-5)-methyltransferase 3A
LVLKKELKPKYFFLENVKMKKDYQDVISKFLGVEPVLLDSNLVSAQNRKRLYWTNIKGFSMPKDKGILLKDVVHEGSYQDALSSGWEDWIIRNGNKKFKDKYSSLSPDKAITLIARHYASWNGNFWFESLSDYIIPYDKTLEVINSEIKRGKVRFIRTSENGDKVFYVHGKDIVLNRDGGKYLFGCITPDRVNKRQNGQRFNKGRKFYTLTSQDRHGILTEGYIRKLSPVECERLQTLPDGYTDCVSRAQRYKTLGNGWTIDAVCEFFKHIK